MMGNKKEYKEIFIFVAGTTPQILTETIYALSQKKPSICPDEIFIITTKTGKSIIKETLIKKGIFSRLINEYELPEVAINEESFIIPRDSAGNEMKDIKDECENEVMGDLITSVVKEKSQDIMARLHCSIAGGRKTMSFYLGAALQFFGRPWDRLYHVLVSPEFESNPEFFYKPKKEKIIEAKLPDGTFKKVSTEKAEILLAELPFIRLRSKLSLHGKSFKEMVEEGQKEIDSAVMQLPLIVKFSERTINIGNDTVQMTPVQLSIYTTFLRQKTDCCKCPERAYCLECSDCFVMLKDFMNETVLKTIEKDYSYIYIGNPSRPGELMVKWSKAYIPDIIRQNISKINKIIKEQMNNESLLPYYTIASMKKYGSSRYGVKAEKGKIRIE